MGVAPRLATQSSLKQKMESKKNNNAVVGLTNAGIVIRWVTLAARAPICPSTRNDGVTAAAMPWADAGLYHICRGGCPLKFGIALYLADSAALLSSKLCIIYDMLMFRHLDYVHHKW